MALEPLQPRGGGRVWRDAPSLWGVDPRTRRWLVPGALLLMVLIVVLGSLL